MRRQLGPVSVRLGAEGRAHYYGLCRCGSVWECPVDAQAVAMERCEEVRTALERHRAAGGGDYLATFTTPHDLGDALHPMRRHVARGWQFVISGAPWQRIRKRYGLDYIRAHEVTCGPNGWHPHLHVVLLTSRPLTDAQRAELTAFLLRRWQRAILRPQKDTGTQYRIPLAGVGVKLVHATRDDYIAKLGLADELSQGVAKRGHDDHRTGFQVLRDVWRVDGANKRDVALWCEYGQAMRGARQLTWSRGLRARCKLPAEQTDLAIVTADDADPEPLTIYDFSPADWDDVLAPDVGLRLRVLAIVEQLPPQPAAAQILALLDRARGIPAVPF